MTNDARQVANWFVERFRKDGRSLSVMELLKLTYIAHGWHLEIFGTPLFENRIEAWRHGPVIPDVYNAFRSQGQDVREPVPGFARLGNESDIDLLEQVYGIYGEYNAYQLSDLTHVPGGPWHVTMEIGGPFTRIPDSVIKQHYVERRARLKRARSANVDG
ncbi:MAG: DUF4065 domain-containing protein [Rhodobacteraceae bacterium]|nr:DUF4065 domain-containing protein [Paracoccaceae bacterium]